MMRLAIPFVLVAGAAVAEDFAINGTYADAGGCARLAGEPATSDMVFILHPDRVERYESSCEIGKIRVEDGLPVQLDVNCMGEGDTWTDSYAIKALDGEEGYLIGPMDMPDVRFEVRRCE